MNNEDYWICYSNRLHKVGRECDCWETWFKLLGGAEEHKDKPAEVLRAMYRQSHAPEHRTNY
jgi:hypothetical protein